MTNSEGDILTVTDAVAGSFTATGWDTEYVSSSGAVDYENCLAPSPTYGGAYAPFCAYITLYDGTNTTNHYETTTSNSESVDIYDACDTLVASGSAYGAYIIGTDYMMSDWLGGEPISLPTSDPCPGTWTATYSYSQTFHDGDTLTDSASTTFTWTGSPEVSLAGGGYLLDSDPTTQCPCATPTAPKVPSTQVLGTWSSPRRTSPWRAPAYLWSSYELMTPGTPNSRSYRAPQPRRSVTDGSITSA